MIKKGIISSVLWLVVICFLGGAVRAENQTIVISAAKSAQPSDVVLVIDNSGSMKKTDPVNKATNESLGTLATKMIINSTPLNGSKIGIVSFSAQLSDKRFRTDSLACTDDMSKRKELLGYVDEIKKEGRKGGTNIPAGIAEATRMLSQSQAENKAIILITDGENDPKRDTTDPWAKDPILKEIKSEVPIYAIGLKAGVPENKQEAFKDYLNKIAKSEERVFAIESTDKIPQTIQEIDSMVYKAEKIVEFPIGEIGLEIPEHVKTCAMSFVSINNKDIDLCEVTNTQNQNVINDRARVYSSSVGSIANLTLTKPEKGLWKVMIKGSEGDRVRVEWKVVLESTSATPVSTSTPIDPHPDPDPIKIPWKIIIIALSLLVLCVVAVFLLRNPVKPSIPGYMRVCINQPDGSSMILQNWLDLGTIKNSAKKPVTLGRISGLKELNGVRIEQGDYNYEITLRGQLPPNIYGLQNGLNTDDSCTLIYDDGKQVEFTYKSFLC